MGSVGGGGNRYGKDRWREVEGGKANREKENMKVPRSKIYVPCWL